MQFPCPEDPLPTMAVTFAQIEPTTRCNFTCGFCVGRHMPQGDLSWEDFEAFLFAHPHLRHVELQGEGEPMLHPRFFDMVAACGKRGIKVSIITNGSLFTPDRVEKLIESGVSTLHVSLESSDPKRFRELRGGLFEKVKTGVALLMERRRHLDRATPKVGLAVTVLKSTMAAFPGIRELYDHLGLDGGISVQPLQTMPDYAGVYDEAMADEVPGRELMPQLRAIRASALAAEPGGADTFYAALFAGADLERDGCPWLVHGAYLGNGGSIAPCCFVKRPDLAFGRLGQQTPEEIHRRRAWTNAELRKGRIPAPCSGCGTAKSIASASLARARPSFILTAPTLS